MHTELGSQEILQGKPYKEVLRGELNNSAFWEIMDYKGGELIYRRNGIKPLDLLKKYGDPYDCAIQVTDLWQVTQRASLLKDIFVCAAEPAGYPLKNLAFFYAEKANFTGPVVNAALKEVNLEVTREPGLQNFLNLRRKGLIPSNKRIICNGFKSGNLPNRYDKGYGQLIIEAHREGVDITPVLTQNELPFYQERVKGKPLNVGLRLKFGPVSTDAEQESLVSRFGFTWKELQTEAEKINNSENIKLTMLHAMVSAASSVAPEVFVKSALYAAEKYAILKRMYPSLKELNLGGGIPPIDDGYNYNAFLIPYLRGIKEICRNYGVDLPTIVVESGSFIATDCETLVYRIIDANRNTPDGVQWMTFNGSLTNVSDVWIQKQHFPFVAINNAGRPAVKTRLGDATCDSNDVYPPKPPPGKPYESIQMPDRWEDLGLLAWGVGAYEDALGGLGRAKEAQMVTHCAIPEPIQVYIWQDEQGHQKIWAGKRASTRDESNIVGFNPKDFR